MKLALMLTGLERKNLSNLIEERNELSFDLLRENKLWY